MDKYIRTNRSIIKIKTLIDITSEKYVNDCIQSGFKTSDKIEDLCDEFIGINNNEHQFLKAIPYKCFNYWNGGVYGGIWIDRWLIYVAKMNDKGEFELL